MMALSVLWTFGAGLSIFIYSISELEGSLKGLTGRPFKKFLHRQTAHPLRAVAAGAFVTALLQSSSVVMLLTLSFVGAGVLSTRNALALTIGSNIGTTFDSWLIALIGFKFDIESFAFPILPLALLLRVFRRDRTLVDR
ncbi:MAG: Na/Pi symporter [Bacteroidota bacterium]